MSKCSMIASEESLILLNRVTQGNPREDSNDRNREEKSERKLIIIKFLFRKNLVWFKLLKEKAME